MYDNIQDYKGFSFEVFEEVKEWDEYGPGRTVYCYEAIKDGKTISLDWSSYNRLTQEDFNLWIDLGCPDRHHPALEKKREKFAVRVYCPLSRKDLEYIQKNS